MIWKFVDLGVVDLEELRFLLEKGLLLSILRCQIDRGVELKLFLMFPRLIVFFLHLLNGCAKEDFFLSSFLSCSSSSSSSFDFATLPPPFPSPSSSHFQKILFRTPSPLTSSPSKLTEQ